MLSGPNTPVYITILILDLLNKIWPRYDANSLSLMQYHAVGIAIIVNVLEYGKELKQSHYRPGETLRVPGG